MTRPSIEGYFNPAQREALRRQDRVAFKQKQLKKRLIRAFFGVIIIAAIPLIFPHQRDFDVIHNAPLFMAIIGAVMMYGVVVASTSLGKSLGETDKGERIVSAHTDVVDFTNFIVGLFAFFTVLNAFFFSLASIAIDNSDSMRPTLAPGDQLIIRHIGIRYERGDIVVARIDASSYYVKRIIALPGETIACANNQLTITDTNGVTFDLEEPYLPTTHGTCIGLLQEGEMVALEDDAYFLLGDNRLVSSDSRDANIGPIPYHRLHGKIIFRTLPIGDIGKVD